MDRIHFSRLLDFLSGSAAVAANTKVQKSALYRDFDAANLESKKLRALIDSNMPTFYVVDLDLIYKEIYRNLSLSLFKDNEEYVTNTVFSNKQKLSSDILKTLTNSFSTVPRKKFTPILAELNTLYTKTLDTLSKRSSYIGYRNAVTVLSAEVRRKLKFTGMFIAEDDSLLVDNLPTNSYLFIGPTFNYVKNKVNSLINDSIRKLFKEVYSAEMRAYDNKNNTGFSVGNLVNAGHTAAYTNTNDLIGVNMPSAQEVQFLLAGTGKEQGVEAAIADLYLNSDYAIKFTQNFKEGASTLLDLQFSFVISMPSEFNTNTLRIQEVRRIKEYISDTILPEIKDQVLKKFKEGILTEAIPELSASPNILEYISSSIVSKLGGKATPSLQKTTTASKQGIKIKTPVLKNTKLVPKSTSTKSSSINVPKYIPIRTNQGQFYSLTSLQGLINQHLQSVISANMGDEGYPGGQRKILNYRTGRFAASAQVERMSQSREGAITAFYSYQKNPYQVFEVGHKMGSPITRDPKLLISKSIREIAATKVGNRLRAVSV